MTNLEPLLDRNRAFVAAGRRSVSAPIPRFQLFVVTCIDPRVDPAAFLGIELGDAIVLRNAGGRINDAVIADVAFISFLGEQMGAGTDGDPLEVAVVHHTQCGTGLLANAELRQAYADRTGFDPDELAGLAVTDPATSVRADVERLRTSPLATSRITVSGHVYDLETGLVTTIVDAVAPIADAAAAVSA